MGATSDCSFERCFCLPICPRDHLLVLLLVLRDKSADKKYFSASLREIFFFVVFVSFVVKKW
jgi:hypothetical protein